MEPDVCLFIFPEARVCGAEQHLIRLLGIWELLFTEPPEQKRARQEGQGGEGRGKKHVLRCLGGCSQLLPTLEESFEFLALDVTTTRSLFSQNPLVLEATAHTSAAPLRRNE